MTAAPSRYAIPLRPQGGLFRSARYPDVKDPAIVHDGSCWHLFGTGCGRAQLEILHWTASTFDGPWREQRPVFVRGVDHISHRAAPGVAAEGLSLHMFLQESFNTLGGTIEHLVSHDGGDSFEHQDRALVSVAGIGEAGIYDCDPAEIGGQRYLTYAAMSEIGQPDLFLARSASGSWDGPWERCGPILSHREVDYHNQVEDEDYEWGLEGPQLVELPDGRVLLTAVCFLSEHPKGSRQRVLFATAEDPVGPYELLGPLLEPVGAGGENGHGTAVIDGDRLRVVYQERGSEGQRWQIRHASAGLGSGGH